MNGYLALLADGHGSTRGVANSLGQVVQEYNYDAYGNAIGFVPKNALTNLLYSGEQFNPVSGLQYLRARWYNPENGRFNRLDPYFGNHENPLSFHKYAYAHMNPVMGIDPSGLFTLLDQIFTGGGVNIPTASAASYLGSAAAPTTLGAILTPKVLEATLYAVAGAAGVAGIAGAGYRCCFKKELLHSNHSRLLS